MADKIPTAEAIAAALAEVAAQRATVHELEGVASAARRSEMDARNALRILEKELDQFWAAWKAAAPRDL